SRIHFGARDIANEGFSDLFVMALKAGKEKRLVLAVIESGDHDSSAGGGTHFMIGEGIARNNRVRECGCLAAFQLLEVLAVHEAAFEIPVLEAAVELVGAALHDAREFTAGGVAEFGAEPGGLHL